MHARLVAGNQVLMGGDAHPGHPYEGVKGCSVAVQVNTPAEAERLFNALAENGTIRCRWGRPSGPSASACSPTSSACPG